MGVYLPSNWGPGVYVGERVESAPLDVEEKGIIARPSLILLSEKWGLDSHLHRGTGSCPCRLSGLEICARYVGRGNEKYVPNLERGL